MTFGITSSTDVPFHHEQGVRNDPWWLVQERSHQSGCHPECDFRTFVNTALLSIERVRSRGFREIPLGGAK